MARKILFVILGILLAGLGLFISFAILVYSLKEQDNSGFFCWGLTFPMIIAGIYSILKAKKIK
ncbi:MAG: hypothetical protein WKF68_10110 [Daejeonella sp.]